eukprot:g4093.t1
MGAGASTTSVGDGPSFDDVAKWSKEEVGEQVSAIGEAFEPYKDIAIKNDVDGQTLLDLDDEDLEECIASKMHRKKIRAKLDAIKAQVVAAPAATAAAVELEEPAPGAKIRTTQDDLCAPASEAPAAAAHAAAVGAVPPACDGGVDFTPPKDAAATAASQARLVEIEAELAAAGAAGGVAAEQHCGIEECVGAIRAVLNDAVEGADVELLRTVASTSGGLHRNAYAACHEIVKTDASHEELLVAARTAAARFPGVSPDGARTCQQPVDKLGMLYAHARETMPRFQAQMRAIVDGELGDVEPDKHGEPRIKLHPGPLKHLYRCIEKMCFKVGERRHRCESVCDVVRCIVECSDCELMVRVLGAITGCPDVVVQRVKDRANNVTSMEWMDVMVNLALVGDANSHVCEVQVVHSKMLLARSGLGGHEPYAKLRAASEMLEVLGVEIPAFGNPPAMIPVSVPDLPDVICARAEVVEDLCKHLLRSDASSLSLASAKRKCTGTGDGMKLSAHGQGGVGKTTLAAMLVRHDMVRRSFDRIGWVSVGQAPDILELQRLLFTQLTGGVIEAKPGSTHELQLQALQALQEASAGKRWLVVLDDVWDNTHEKLLNCVDDNTQSKLFVTTRIRGLLKRCDEISLELLTRGEAVDLLLNTGGAESTDNARAAAEHVAELCGDLPLFIGICGGIIANYDGATEWQAELIEMLQEDRLMVMGTLEGEEGETVQRIVGTSLAMLKNETAKSVFQLLSLCPEDVPIPMEAVSLIWMTCHPDQAAKANVLAVRKVCKLLLDRNLLTGSTADGVHMHDIRQRRDWLRPNLCA